MRDRIHRDRLTKDQMTAALQHGVSGKSKIRFLSMQDNVAETEVIWVSGPKHHVRQLKRTRVWGPMASGYKASYKLQECR